MRGLALLLSLALVLAGCASVEPDSVAPSRTGRPALEPPAPKPPVPTPPAAAEHSLVVSASAYNSLRSQTDATPTVAAWGDRLHPGMKVIAVSADLLERGLVRGMRVEIEGLPGEYVVLDRMPRRWKNKIDIYMGEDVAAARLWGVREVRIRWREGYALGEE